MPYDSRATLVSRLTEIRTAIEKTRTAQAYETGSGMSTTRARLKELLAEEAMILEKIEAIDRYSDGFFNKVKFQRPV